jgi:hypothetical protein
MSILQGKGIWTLYDDVNVAVTKASSVGANFIFCKVSKHGIYDPTNAHKALTAVSKKPELLPVAWCYPYLEDIAKEADCIKQAFADGFSAFVIDAELDTANKFPQAAAFVQQVLASGADPSLIYLCADPRLDTKLTVFPYIQLAEICQGGFMVMAYGELLPSDKPNAAVKVVGNAYKQYAKHCQPGELKYTSPLMPILSSYWDAQAKSRMKYAELKLWTTEAQKHHPTFVSLYRAGVTRPEAWKAFKELKVSSA